MHSCKNRKKEYHPRRNCAILMDMDIIMQDSSILVCVKPVGVLSTDVPGGLPELLREALGDPGANVRTVHRLDQVAGGLMVLARTRRAASELGGQIMAGHFEKEYLAVVHGHPAERGRLTDLLLRDRARRRTLVVDTPRKGAQEAVLDYTVLGTTEALALVRVTLLTGRTHQIRVQFSSRGLPLVGERKYASLPEECGLALWSARLAFDHPRSGERIDLRLPPPEIWPWTAFPQAAYEDLCNREGSTYGVHNGA